MDHKENERMSKKEEGMNKEWEREEEKREGEREHGKATILW